MRKTVTSFVAAAIIVAAGSHAAQAAFFSYPRGLSTPELRQEIQPSALPPVAQGGFCGIQAADCDVQLILI